MNFSSIKLSSVDHPPLRIKFASDEFLTALTANCAACDEIIMDLYKWRLAATEFKDLKPPTFSSTRNWFEKYYLANQNKILFLVNKGESRIGHIGLNLFFSTSALLEVDNVIRGKKDCCRGIMSRSLQSMLEWYNTYNSPNCVYLRTTDCNVKAIKFYKSNGFIHDSSASMKHIYSENKALIDGDNFAQACEESDTKYIVLRLNTSY